MVDPEPLSEDRPDPARRFSGLAARSATTTWAERKTTPWVSAQMLVVDAPHHRDLVRLNLRQGELDEHRDHLGEQAPRRVDDKFCYQD